MITAITLIFSNYFLIKQNACFCPAFWALVLSTVLVAAGGYLINDFYDITIDLQNKPNKVLIGKIFSKQWAMISYAIINFCAVALGFGVAETIGWINIFCILSLWVYAFWLKKTPLLGNIWVAFLSALAILLLNIFYETYEEAVVLLAVLPSLFLSCAK